MKRVPHVGQVRAGRWQCNGCRAAWATEEAAKGSKFSCPKVPLPHGHRFDREHRVHPTWSKDVAEGYGANPLCDDAQCPCMSHQCDCDVCTETIKAPGLNVLQDDHEQGGWKLSSYESHRFQPEGAA